jgi:phosphoserine phosphatase
VHHDAEGRYTGFDERSPLSRAGGKIDVVSGILRATPGALAIVGDGSTDLEAAVLADRFVAFGAVARRANVFESAVSWSMNPDLWTLLPLLTTDDERARLREPARPTQER